MKKCGLLLGLLVVSTIMFAQRKGDPVDRAAKRADKMKNGIVFG